MGDGKVVERGCGKSVVKEEGRIGCVIFIIGCVSELCI